MRAQPDRQDGIVPRVPNRPGPRRCAKCRREFDGPQQYMGTGNGIVCRNRKACEARQY